MLYILFKAKAILAARNQEPGHWCSVMLLKRINFVHMWRFWPQHIPRKCVTKFYHP